MFEIAATNLRIVREKLDPENKQLPTKLQPGDTVLIQNHARRPFDPRYIGDYRVVGIKEIRLKLDLLWGDPLR